MRLLKLLPDGKWGVTSDHHKNELLLYAILSHTWDHDGHEVTFDDLVAGAGTTKRGWQKLEFCVRQTNIDGLRHVWCDSCCINKSNATEKHDAFNTMFSWYAEAHICYVYLADVTSLADLARSRWWTRGWTLQELLAPKDVVFYSRDGACLGTKLSLLSLIHEITGIAESALSGEKPLLSFDIEERLSWMKGRRTTFEEDYAYCLQGVLGVEIARRYGEGLKRAIERLREEAAFRAKPRRRTRISPAKPLKKKSKASTELAFGSPAGFGSSQPFSASKPVFGAPGASRPPPPPDALYGQPQPEVFDDLGWDGWDDVQLDYSAGDYAEKAEYEGLDRNAQQDIDPWDGADVVVTLEDLGLTPSVGRPLDSELHHVGRNVSQGSPHDRSALNRNKDKRNFSGDDSRRRQERSLASGLTLEEEDDLANL